MAATLAKIFVLVVTGATSLKGQEPLAVTRLRMSLFGFITRARKRGMNIFAGRMAARKLLVERPAVGQP